ncbi:MAG: hypothetical protein CMO80_18605 [Verrucomicrobiales bacterium]|nr:hypothetical protein [Verrucomicrobiales bacterium]|tara:strand:+ start:4095 stop:5129 length:1035 start_codon:yes stop_codon:yes gene_type:complete
MKEFHENFDATFAEVNGVELVSSYGDASSEYQALKKNAALIDLSPRGRLCLVGEDRSKFLHGQVTNDINSLAPGTGCYALLVTNKGKVQADMNVFNLGEELLLDLEPGGSAFVTERLENYIVADDVEICDVQEQFGLLTVQGPKAAEAIGKLNLDLRLPDQDFGNSHLEDATLGSIYIANHPRLMTSGFDLFAETGSLPAIADKMIQVLKELGGCAAGWDALETSRIEAGIPRCGLDMDERNLAPEAGVEERAISYRKGCYIGQEVLNRLHNFADTKKALVRLELTAQLEPGTPLRSEDKKVGYITSTTALPGSGRIVGLGYAKKPKNEPDTRFQVDGGTARVL